MPQPTESQLLNALRQVTLNGQDLVKLGLVGGITVNPEGRAYKVSVILQASAPGHPSLAAGSEKIDIDALRKKIELSFASIADISSVSVILTAHQPQPAARQPHTPQKIPLPGVRYVVAIASGKGGVGKSTTSVNLAAAFVQQGLKVGLLDADIYGPSIPRMLALTGKPETRADKKMVPHQKFGMSVMSMGFLISEDTPMIWRGPMVHTAITQLFRDVDWGTLDVLVVDLPPGTGDAQLTLAQSAPLSGAVIVSTPQDIALLDARKGLAMFQKVDVPVLGIVENMSYFLCPHCGERSEIFSHGGAREEADKLSVPFLGEIPLHIAVREKSDEGYPITLSLPNDEIALLYRTMAKNLWTSLTSRG